MFWPRRELFFSSGSIDGVHYPHKVDPPAPNQHFCKNFHYFGARSISFFCHVLVCGLHMFWTQGQRHNLKWTVKAVKWQIWVFLGISCSIQWQSMKGGLGDSEPMHWVAEIFGDKIDGIQMDHHDRSHVDWACDADCYYPHALHSRHGSEGPEGSQGPHCPEGLNPSRAKERGSEVDQWDLGLLVCWCWHVSFGYFNLSSSYIYCQWSGVSKAC